jgi:hypothetical protein
MVLRPRGQNLNDRKQWTLWTPRSSSRIRPSFHPRPPLFEVTVPPELRLLLLAAHFFPYRVTISSGRIFALCGSCPPKTDPKIWCLESQAIDLANGF